MFSALDSTSFLGTSCFSACPTCARPLTPIFDLQVSATLDAVIIALDALHDLKATLEERAGL
jgi:hypothetical protein